MKNIVVLFLSSMLSFVTIASNAQTPGGPGSFPILVLKGSDSAIVQNAILENWEPNFFDPSIRSTILGTNKLENVITLKIDEETGIFIPDSFSIAIVLEITKTDSLLHDSVFQKTLQLKYQPQQGIVSGSQNYYVTQGGYKIKAKILSITHNANWDVTEVLQLESSIESDYNYLFNCSTTINSITNNAAVLAQNNNSFDELTINWSAVSNAQTHYDIEWAWIDENAVTQYQLSSSNNEPYDWNVKKVFTNNSSRVTVARNILSYKIPLLYDGAGYLVYRVRPVKVNATGRYEGAWSYPDLQSGMGSYFFAQGHVSEMNWQASTSYAEDGKRKSVVQYFDGTLRNRQTVTKDNSIKNAQGEDEPTTIVAETFYDYQGRPTIQVLPSPTLNTVIEFAHNFNRNSITNIGYEKNNYDEVLSTTACDDGAVALSASNTNGNAGAAFYYGPNNIIPGNSTFNKYIPDANGYAFTETRYTNDATGRIKAQSGVGQMHKLGSGHETKYYYTGVLQQEVDALFGTEVGDASHYFKSIVQDANGQFSVSYQDMFGRTIATALAGNAPANLQALESSLLPSAISDRIEKTLLDVNTNVIKGNAIEMVKELVVTKPGLHTFAYKLDPESLQLNDCKTTPPKAICYDCLYDLVITITGECDNIGLVGQPNYIPGVGIQIKKSNFTITAPNNIANYASKCPPDKPDNFNLVFDVDIQQTGSYTITKTLTIHQPAQDYFRDKVYMANNDCKTLESIKTDFYNIFSNNGTNCGVPTCDACVTLLASGEQGFINKFKADMGITTLDEVAPYIASLQAAYKDAVENCALICDNLSNSDRVTNYREILKRDMMPDGGQYARLLVPNSTSNDIYFIEPTPPITPSPATALPFNIFNTQVPGGPRYKYPRNADGILTDYKDGYGNIDDIAKAAIIAPTYESFINNFNESWADNLLYYHPEFKKLQLIETPEMVSCTKWGEKITNAKDLATAITSLGPVLLPASFVLSDPFYNSNTVNPAIKQSLRNKYDHYITLQTSPDQSKIVGMWQFAVLSVKCMDFFTNFNNAPDAYYTCVNDETIPNTFPYFPANTCAEDKEKIWGIFKSIYFTEREIQFQNHLQDKTGINNNELISNGYNVRFKQVQSISEAGGNLPKYIADAIGDNSPGSIANAVNDAYTETCRSYVENWLLQLEVFKNCAASTSSISQVDLNALTQELVNICVAGSDQNHTLGSSSVPVPYTDGRKSSFEEIIQQFMIDKGITQSETCHPYVIDWPKPYDKSMQFTNAELVTKKAEECICTRLAELKSAYDVFKIQNPSYYGTFQQYLAWWHGTNISLQDLNTLTDACRTNTTIDCRFLTTPITIPPALQCAATNSTCISCDEYKALKIEFNEKFTIPGDIIIPIAAPRTELEQSWNNTFQQFMNYRTGFTKQWHEYAEFEVQCSPYTGNPSFTCEIVIAFVKTYLEDYSTPNPLPANFSCEQQFVDAFNANFSLDYTYSQIETLYNGCSCTALNVCSPPNTITRGKIEQTVIAFYNVNGNAIFNNEENCINSFTTFFNNAYQTNNNYEEINIMYQYLADGGNLLIQDKLNPIRLRMIVTQYINIYGNNTYAINDCKNHFTTFFNTYVGTNFSANEVFETFDSKSVPLNVCKPPYSSPLLQETQTIFFNQYGGDISDSSNCANLFLQFFNQQHQANFTWQALQQLYIDVTGKALAVCQLKVNCVTLTSLYDEFKGQFPDSTLPANCSQLLVSFLNTQLNCNYTFAQWQQLFKAKCDEDIITLCNNTPIEITNGHQLQQIVNSFLSNYPSPNAEFNNKCLDEFTSYTNLLLGTRYSASEIVTLYNSLCNKPLEVCNSTSAISFQNFVSSFNDKYFKLKLPTIARQLLFAKLFNRWYNSTDELYFNDIEAMFSNIGLTLNLDLTNDVGTVTIDTQILNSMVIAFDAFNANDELITCTDDFTAFFKLCMGEEAPNEFGGLQPLYLEVTGRELNVCTKVQPKSINLSKSSCNPVQPRLCGLNQPMSPSFELQPEDPCADIRTMASNAATEYYEAYLSNLKNDFDKAYQNKCLSAQSIESFTVKSAQSEYHYTLYYYDQAGNLVKTVPPAGVKKYSSTTELESFLTLIKSKRASNTDEPIVHNLVTEYRYNTLNQVVEQKTPDANTSKFWYDVLGRLVVSQNEQQAQSNPALYSYTLYDELGRITEVGQKPQSDPMNTAISRLPNQAARLAGTVPTATHTSLDEWLNTAAFNQTKEQITRTVYDLPYVNSVLCPLLCQQNLRNRVSYVQVFDVDPASLPTTTPDKHQAATYYTYDISGNVTELLQDINQGPMASTGNRFKKLTYSFDLISGKVNEVAYQAGQPDEFYHRYLYDAENKITEVFTSSDYIKWDNDASYTYYKHGPLARTILGQQRVQGIDYAYTLQGWLKGVNSSSVITDGTTGQSINAGKFDMGKDGYYNSTNTNKYIARDVYSYQLNYFDGDYTPIGGDNPFVKTGVHSLPATSGTTTQTTAKQLYNGNIASMFVNIPKIGDAQLYGYQYDQLNRLVGMDAYNSFSNHKNNWQGSTPTNLPSSGYQERISYDANGNILTYLRNGALGASGIAMDNMSYQYSKDNTTGKLLSNQLRYVHDAASTSAYTTDIKNNAPIGINSKDDIDGEKLAVNQPGDNYQYDKIGNLIADKKEDIINIEWTVYGKISTITKSNSSIQYTYDASGNRISKAVIMGGQTNYTYYVRDATGNVMSVYEKNSTLNGNLLTQSEVHLYGSSRLGVININRQAEVFTPGPNDEIDMGYFARGKKLYELTNHLGNVLVTISDKKIAGITGSLVPGVRNNPITHYMAEVVTANDYFPGGMIMPGRKYEQPNSNYRYGFNGKEKDNELKGEGNQIDYGMRVYDPRLVRFLSVDLLTRNYAMLSPFQYASNRLIDGIDLDGLEFLPYRKSMYQLIYSINTSTSILGSGKHLTAKTEQVVVATVYENIPTSLQDSKRNSFKYVKGGVVTAWGRDWDNDKDGVIVTEIGRYYQKGPKFNGLPPGEGDPSDATKPNGRNYGDDVMVSTKLGGLGTLLSAFKEGYEIIENISNYQVWNDLGQVEPGLRKGFYDATNLVDAWRNQNKIGDKSLLNAEGRAGLINFLTDGSLDTDYADNLKDIWQGNIHHNFSNMRKNIYGNALRIAFTGLQIMKGTSGLSIRAETISAVQNTLKKYKENGGGNEYDEIIKIITQQK